MTTPLRIFYAAGPGDVIGTYRVWKEGRDDPSQVAITYSGQFYSLCRELGAQALVISYCPRAERVVDGAFRIENRPFPFRNGPKLFRHLAQVWYGIGLTISAWRFGADVAVCAVGAHWFSLGLMPMLGIKVVPTLHGAFRRQDQPPSNALARLIQKLNGRFFRRRTAGVLSLSNEISSQLAELLAGTPKTVVPFLPSYRRESFAQIGEPPATRPFHVFFAGRIERNKGVFDLLDIARRFASEGVTDVTFDLCGDGGALAELRQAAETAGLAGQFHCHGHCDRTRMRQMYSQSHVIIVPTTSECTEGFNKVVAEGVLAGRPVITSSACPALEYVRDAVVEVPMNDTQAYGDAILRLKNEPALYESKRRGCGTAQEQFYDVNRGWAAGVKRMLRLVEAGNTDNSRAHAGESVARAGRP